jgi:hypothetical protein
MVEKEKDQQASTSDLTGQQFRTPPTTNTTGWLEKYVAWASKALEEDSASRDK